MIANIFLSSTDTGKGSFKYLAFDSQSNKKRYKVKEERNSMINSKIESLIKKIDITNEYLMHLSALMVVVSS